MDVLTPEQARAADRITIEQCGISSAELMERAGAAVVQFIVERYGDALAGRIAVLCGPGNNGGDGKVVARRLRGMQVEVEEVHFDGGSPVWNRHRAAVMASTLCVDGLFGTGLNRAIAGDAAQAIRDLNADYQRPVVAIDLPSGLGTDGAVLRCSATVTFTAPKVAHFFAPAASCCGPIRIVQIGTPPGIVAGLGADLHLGDAGVCAPYLQPRDRDGHKGSYGHVAVVGGAAGKTGAAVLAGSAALRMGAGLVTLITPPPGPELVALARPELMSEPLLLETAGAAAWERASVLAMGPGLGGGDRMAAAIRGWARSAKVPCVLDADGLNAFAGQIDELRLGAGGVLTPHPGEMARLYGVAIATVQYERLEWARKLAVATGAVVVLKGHRTLITDPAGQVWINTTGNPGMATAGAGDVLSGMIAGLLAQFSARNRAETAAAAVYLHGLAGDLANAAGDEMSLIAGDLIAALPEALRQARAAGSTAAGEVHEVAA